MINALLSLALYTNCTQCEGKLMSNDNALNELLHRQDYLQAENERLTKAVNTCEPYMYHVYSRSLASNKVFLGVINAHILRYEELNGD